MKVVRRGLNLQAGIIADCSLRGQGRGGNPQSRVAQRDGLTRSIIARVDGAIDRNAAFRWIGLVAGESLHCQVRMGAEVGYAPLPRDLCRPAESSGNSGSADSLCSQGSLQLSERNVQQRGSKLRLRRCIQMLDLPIRCNAAAQGVHGEFPQFQIAAGQLVGSLESSQLQSIAGSSSRKDFARKLAVDGNVPQEGLDADRLVVKLAG